MTAARLPVLTYHSVSDAAGPTSMPPSLFRMQMDVLALEGFRSMTVQDFLDWKAGRIDGERRVLITFDDGFADFGAKAAPVLKARGFTALMFVPTGKIGGDEAWTGANAPPRPLMTWDQVKALADTGMEFGAHAITHPNLTKLGPEARRHEIVQSGLDLAERLGRPTRTFAAPYGHVDKAVLADVSQAYEAAFGVRLDRATRDCDPFDIPRIEMHYFRERRHWRDFLHGADGYFLARRALRSARQVGTRLLSGGARG